MRYFLKFKAWENAHHKISCPSALGETIMGQQEIQISGNEDKLHFEKKIMQNSPILRCVENYISAELL